MGPWTEFFVRGPLARWSAAATASCVLAATLIHGYARERWVALGRIANVLAATALGTVALAGFAVAASGQTALQDSAAAAVLGVYSGAVGSILSVERSANSGGLEMDDGTVIIVGTTLLVTAAWAALRGPWLILAIALAGIMVCAKLVRDQWPSHLRVAELKRLWQRLVVRLVIIALGVLMLALAARTQSGTVVTREIEAGLLIGTGAYVALPAAWEELLRATGRDPAGFGDTLRALGAVVAPLVGAAILVPLGPAGALFSSSSLVALLAVTFILRPLRDHPRGPGR